MFAVICNDMDIVDQELMEHAIKILNNRHSLIITGNGGQGKTSLMMKLAVHMALTEKTINVLWISLNIVSMESIESFWNCLGNEQEYLICLDSPYYNEKVLERLKKTFPVHFKHKVRFIITERIQGIEELLEEENFISGWMEPVSAICCMGNTKEQKLFEVLERLHIQLVYYNYKVEWRQSILKRAIEINYEGQKDLVDRCINEIEKDLSNNMFSVAEQVYEIFSIIEKKYPNISGVNLDWKEWKEHLQRWFGDKSIDEYCYEPIAVCSIFSLELNVDVYANMIGLTGRISDKIKHMIGNHIEPIRYNQISDTLYPKHDIVADRFMYSHPKSDPIECLIQYIKAGGCIQKIFDCVLRKGKIYRNTILSRQAKLDYTPLIRYIEKTGYNLNNYSRLTLAKLWNCTSLQNQLNFIQSTGLIYRLEEFTDSEKGKVYTEVGIILKKFKKYGEAEKIFQTALEKDSEALPIYNELGCLYVEQKKYGEAEKVFLDALEKGNLPSYNELGRLYVEQKKYKEAEKVFLDALEKDSEALPIYNELGRLYVEQKKYKEAEKVFLNALEKDSEALPIYNELGRLYVEQKKYEEAEKIFQTALEKEHLPSYNELGRLYVKQRKYEEAEKVFLDGIKISNDSKGYFLTSLIKLYHKTGNHQKANALINKYTNKTTAYYDSFCKACYIYLKDVKGIKEAIKYKKIIQQMNKRFYV